MLTVHAFIEDCSEEIQLMRGYQRLREDLEYYEGRFTPAMANTMLLKNVLSNEYGTVTNVALAKLCRMWIRSSQKY